MKANVKSWQAKLLKRVCAHSRVARPAASRKLRQALGHASVTEAHMQDAHLARSHKGKYSTGCVTRRPQRLGTTQLM
eukprot:361871-Chlamydomonas_euryale.AAC.21